MWREKGKREVQQPRLDGFSWSAHLCKRIIWFTRQRVAARGNSGVVEGKRLIGQKSVVISFINATMLFLHCVPVVNISALFMFLLVNFMSLIKPSQARLQDPGYRQQHTQRLEPRAPASAHLQTRVDQTSRSKGSRLLHNWIRWEK